MGTALEGIRVLDCSQFEAGPSCAETLAWMGAEVIKIEPPTGEQARYGFSEQPGVDSTFFCMLNMNKKSVTLNLKHPRARDVLHALVRTADATFDNLRGDQPEKLGLTYAQLQQVNPRIVCAHLSAYGREGERKAWPGYDYLMQAEAGYLSVTGEPDGPPSRMGLSIVDLMTGLNAAFALVSGVLSARATGQGREPRSAHPSLVPSQLYRTKDGFIFIMCNKEKFWPELCRAIGRPEWSARPQYKDFKGRLANRDRLTEELDAALSARTTAEWIEVFGGRVPAAPVNDLASALENPFATARGRVRTVEHATGPIRLLAPSVDCPGEVLPCAAAPAMGADTDAVLGEVGFGSAEIAILRKAGAL